MDKYLDDYGSLDKKQVVSDMKEAIDFIKENDFSSAADILNDIAEALYNCEE